MKKLKNKIIIVDDDSDLTNELKKILSEVGYEVKIYNSPQFIHAFTEHLPDVVLMDVWFQGEPDGLNEVRALKLQKVLARVPVILISSDPQLAEYAQSIQANGYLTKPLDPEQLIAMLDQVLHH